MVSGIHCVFFEGHEGEVSHFNGHYYVPQPLGEGDILILVQVPLALVFESV